MKEPRIRPVAILQAVIPATLVFLLVNAAAEYLLHAVTGISIVHAFEQKTGVVVGARFHAFNLAAFFAEMYLVMVFYALIRPRFASAGAPGTITVAFFFAFTALFLVQMVNLSVYPPRVGAVFMAATALSFPLSVYTGAHIYDRLGPQ